MTISLFSAKYFVGHFCYITRAMVKVNYMPEFYTWVILLMNQSEEIDEKQLSVFSFRGGQISPLMHIHSVAISEFPNQLKRN